MLCVLYLYLQIYLCLSLGTVISLLLLHIVHSPPLYYTYLVCLYGYLHVRYLFWKRIHYHLWFMIHDLSLFDRFNLIYKHQFWLMKRHFKILSLWTSFTSQWKASSLPLKLQLKLKLSSARLTKGVSLEKKKESYRMAVEWLKLKNKTRLYSK